MKGRRERTGIIAKERLKLMLEAEPVDFGQDKMTQMKKEISEIVGRYFDVLPDEYEIKVILKSKREKSILC
jgi:cell division topological specificity factor MinE